MGPDFCPDGPAVIFTTDFVEDRVLHEYQLTENENFRLAKLTDRRAAVDFRVTNELSTMTPYEIPRKFAELFDSILSKTGKHAFEGILFRPRFDTGSDGTGVALFGDSGERGWKSIAKEIDDSLTARLARYSIEIDDPPSIDDLDVIED
ncbi:hypothetical protein [Streptomyces sp. STR69]|uniref:hypothetical protein n=1 Tax=Streptomyces sp. STR69 TaxID=1796942 RepID=UPI0021CA3778|nr:hypothetical protein [Streptomyces sp. STR69]